MIGLHPYGLQLAETAGRKLDHRTTIKVRTLMEGFGHRQRNERAVADIHIQLQACGLLSNITVQTPARPDDQVAVMVTNPRGSAQPNGIPLVSNLFEIAAQAVAATIEIQTPRGMGSGFLVHPDGLAVTARHVVDDGDLSLPTVKARVGPGTNREIICDATVLWSHSWLDVALIWLHAEVRYPFLPFGNPRRLKHAQPVLAVGCPSGLSSTVSSGIISNPAQRYHGVECIQTNADIDHGNSGGPLISDDGVVGVTVWGLGQVSAAKFAVPVDYFLRDAAIALQLGRVRCMELQPCRACGALDFERRDWYCHTCGFNMREGHT